MPKSRKFFIDGSWVDPIGEARLEVINPATEAVETVIAAGNERDVDRAVTAARMAFPNFSITSVPERVELLQRALEGYQRRSEELAHSVCAELGAPIGFARETQVAVGRVHLEATIEALRQLIFAERRGLSMVVREAIGVCALITPWNWPLLQIICKVAPALAAGCTVVLKPSEIAPSSAMILAEIIEAAGVPRGVFNLVNGTGPMVGQSMATHPLVDMVSITGSTTAGISVAKAAADTVKRVAQELGGKSANIILPDADFASAVSKGVLACFSNSGQSCDAPTRMLVPGERHEQALAIAKEVAEAMSVGDPHAPDTDLGPVVSQAHFDKIQRLISAGIAEGAALVTGGLGRPDGLARGYYVRPTVFGHVVPSMTIAREEIFGPVLSIMSYRDEDDAVRIANDTVYGLAGYVESSDLEHARSVAGRIRAGTVYINYPDWDPHVPFGGYKQSGNGREYADWGIHEFLEVKAVVGWSR